MESQRRATLGYESGTDLLHFSTFRTKNIMDSVLFEQFWAVAIVGAIITAMTVYAWMQTGNPNVLKGAAGIAILTVILLCINVYVVTDREVVRALVFEMAGELERNEYEKTLQRIHPVPTESVKYRSRQLENIKFSSVRITCVHGIEINRTGSATRAVVRMNIAAEAESRTLRGKALRWIQLTLNKVNDRWLVSDIEDRDPQHEYLNSTQMNRFRGGR